MIRPRKHTITKREMHALSKLKKRHHHHLIHKIHKKHKISYKTLFYMKEYGPKTHVATTIVKQSIKIMILASLISSVGGVHIKSIEVKFALFLPLLIMLPALTDMIGDFGTIASSKFTTMLFTGKVKGNWWRSPHVLELVKVLLAVAMISSIYTGLLSYFVAYLQGYPLSYVLLTKTIFLAVLAAMSLVAIIVAISIVGGLWIFYKKEDPNNFLIPITTSLADFGSMYVLAVLVTMMF